MEILIGIETDRGPWVAAGYTVPAVNPLQAARFRDRLGVSGAKSDAGDAHVLADSAEAEAVKVVARIHKTLIWERTRHTQRLRNALRDCFPAALLAFDDLDAADTLELLTTAPTPAKAARLTIAQIGAAMKRARRKNIAEKAAVIQTVLRSERHPGNPPSPARMRFSTGTTLPATDLPLTYPASRPFAYPECKFRAQLGVRERGTQRSRKGDSRGF